VTAQNVVVGVDVDVDVDDRPAFSATPVHAYV